MSQRYDQSLTLQTGVVSDLSSVPAETNRNAGVAGRAPSSSDSLLLQDAALKAAGFEADGGAFEANGGTLVGSQAVVAASRWQGAAVSRPDFYGRGTRHAARRGWLAWAFLDSYSWRAILLMLSFLAFGLVVSSFVLSL
jgi:hypothetical protein